MKKFLLISIVSLMTMACVSSCIIDWVPVVLEITVEDTDGNDLLDPAGDLSWLEGTVLTHNGNVHELQLLPETKYYMPVDNGFRLEQIGDRYYLTYGELDGAENYDHETFVITWPDGTEDTITLSRSVNGLFINAINIWKLNGKIVTSPITIIK